VKLPLATSASRNSKPSGSRICARCGLPVTGFLIGLPLAWTALAGAALATRFLRPRPHGEWQLWPTVAVAVVAAAAIGASIYIAYLLEIVKLANPRIRRRRRELEQRERRSA